ncbi:carboxypeptidase-like regulatory domain-containing protein, partial [Agriterribacter sp.]|uniref:carboxypeptidase-like regulatory domain-containing protein n=1 Tax=Agriterribacter sp. TaxID=2821509 RepID=UPI002CCCF819
MKKTKTLIVAMLTMLTGISAQPVTGYIKGKVTTADNKPAEGVTILIKNTVKNAVADNNGEFEIKNIQPGSYILAVSLVGYEDAEQEITVESGKATTVSFQLALSNRELNEVVVIANRNSFKTNRTS